MENTCFAQFQSREIVYDHICATDFSVDIPTHTHNGWEFLLVKKGDLSYAVDGNIFHITPNSLIIARPGTVHALHSKSLIHYDRWDLIVTENLLIKELIPHIPADFYVLDVSDNAIILGLFDRIDFYLSNVPREQIQRMLLSLINELWMNIYISTQVPTQSAASSSNPVITKAIHYIREHIGEHLTVQQVSDALFITPSYLYQCFTRHLSITPKQYIMLQKLQLVQQALINAENPTEVCRRYGFSNYSTFYRNYQKAYGCRPSASPKQSLQKIEL